MTAHSNKLNNRDFGVCATRGDAADFDDTLLYEGQLAFTLDDQQFYISVADGGPAVLPVGAAVAFADLPASPVTGMLRTVTDSNTNTWGATIGGSGGNVVLAFYNGTNWTVAAV